jgi:hypothetical protein
MEKNKFEEALAEFADRVFLRIWSFPRPQNRRQKEMCDLLVVSGDHVILFSDKEKKWNYKKPDDLNWTRFCGAALEKNLDQLIGALRNIELWPDQVFTEKDHKPIMLPPAEVRKTHLILTVHGVEDACRSQYGGTGSLRLNMSMLGCCPEVPFTVGDVNPRGKYVHVFDDAALRALSDLDTITDFVNYLEARETIARAGGLCCSASEADLIAYYLAHAPSNDALLFVDDAGRPFDCENPLALPIAAYSSLISGERYKSKKHYDEISYHWDRFIAWAGLSSNQPGPRGLNPSFGKWRSYQGGIDGWPGGNLSTLPTPAGV